MKKYSKKKNIIISILVLIIIIITSIIIGINITKKDKELINYDELIIKESPYTLEELNEIVMNPKEFNKLTTSTSTPFSYTMFHFYDYFSKTTPMLVATKVEKDENGNVTKVLETKNIYYDEYSSKYETLFKFEKHQMELCQEVYETEGVQVCDINFSYFTYGQFVRELVYGYEWFSGYHDMDFSE